MEEVKNLENNTEMKSENMEGKKHCEGGQCDHSHESECEGGACGCGSCNCGCNCGCNCMPNYQMQMHMHKHGRCGHKIVKVILAIAIVFALLSIGAAFGARHAYREGNFGHRSNRMMNSGNRGNFQGYGQVNQEGYGVQGVSGSQSGYRGMMRGQQGNAQYNVQGQGNGQGQVFQITTSPVPTQVVPASNQPLRLVPTK
jgi:hypothetical protein